MGQYKHNNSVQLKINICYKTKMATSTGSYKLDLEPPKRNVFVTQLHQREDDEIQEYPVIREAAGKLLEDGACTLQKTLLLKKEVEVDKVNEELQRKREEFQQRMQNSGDHQIDIQKKQQKMKDRVTKFEKFIQENEAKRRRAIQKYQTEVKLKGQKTDEYEILRQQLEDLKHRHEYLKRKLAIYKKYEDYLLSVVDVLPPNYLEVQDSMLDSLMMRHRTLSATNEGLVENLGDISDELEHLKAELEDAKHEHDKKKLSINSQLSMRQKEQEYCLSLNQEHEQTFSRSKMELRAKRSEVGQILMAIDNIAEKCRRRLDPPIDDMTKEEKLDIVKNFIVDTSDVVEMARPDGSTSPKSERRSPSRRKSPTKSSLKVGFAD